MTASPDPGAVDTPDAGGMTHVEDLASHVEISTDSTVSRTVLKAQGARVVLFSFDTNQELSEHTAAVPVLLAVLDGRLRVEAAGRTITLVPGALVHLDARVPHSVLALEPTRLALTMLDPRTHA